MNALKQADSTVDALEQEYGEARSRMMRVGNEIYDRWAKRKALLDQINTLTDEIDTLSRQHNQAKREYEATKDQLLARSTSPYLPRTRYAHAKEIQRVKRLLDGRLQATGCQWDGRELRAPAGKIFAFTLSHVWRVNPGVRKKIPRYHEAMGILGYGLTACRVRDCAACKTGIYARK